MRVCVPGLGFAHLRASGVCSCEVGCTHIHTGVILGVLGRATVAPSAARMSVAVAAGAERRADAGARGR